MKKKVLKVVLLCVIGILVLYFSFKIGRYSWLIEKPAFLFSTKEKFWVHRARGQLLKDGFAEEKLKYPSVKRTVIVSFKNAAGNEAIVDATLDETSGELLRWTGNR